MVHQRVCIQCPITELLCMLVRSYLGVGKYLSEQVFISLCPPISTKSGLKEKRGRRTCCKIPGHKNPQRPRDFLKSQNKASRLHTRCTRRNRIKAHPVYPSKLTVNAFSAFANAEKSAWQLIPRSARFEDHCCDKSTAQERSLGVLDQACWAPQAPHSQDPRRCPP